jgi:glycosyltransferase involved in cell wall biosynthesis
VIVVSEYMRGLLATANPDAALHRLIRPIRAPDRPIRSRPQMAGDPAVVLFAGRITAEKGLDVLLEAMAALPPDRPVELRIAGVVEDAGYWARCRELAESACRANDQLSVVPLGHLAYDAIDAELARADIVAIPSQWPEPLGAIALEAMAAGAAVVASRIGGLTGSVVDGLTGLLVDPADPAAWSDALGGLLAEPERLERLSAAGRDYVRVSSIGTHVAALDDIVAPLLRR